VTSTFWIKFGLSPKFVLSERLGEKIIQKVKSASVIITVNTLTPFLDA